MDRTKRRDEQRCDAVCDLRAAAVRSHNRDLQHTCDVALGVVRPEPWIEDGKLHLAPQRQSVEHALTYCELLMQTYHDYRDVVAQYAPINLVQVAADEYQKADAAMAAAHQAHVQYRDVTRNGLPEDDRERELRRAVAAATDANTRAGARLLHVALQQGKP